MSAGTLSRVPPSRGGGGALCRPSGIICRRDERDAVDEREVGGTRWALWSLAGSNGTSGRVRCLLGGRSVAPSGIIRREDERDAVDWRVEQKLAGPYIVSQESLGLQAAFRCLRRGRYITPLECSIGGGERDAVDKKRWTETHWDRQRLEGNQAGSGRIRLSRRALNRPLWNDPLEEAKETRWTEE